MTYHRPNIRKEHRRNQASKGSYVCELHKLGFWVFFKMRLDTVDLVIPGLEV